MKIKCPVCRNSVDQQQLKRTASRLPFDGLVLKSGSSHLESFIQTISAIPTLYQWACDDCISQEKAMLANPAAQFYTFSEPGDAASPYLAYFDKNFTCKNCGDAFTFSKEEQKHWYEELEFVVYSKPVHCKACRQTIRHQKNLNTELSGLLREGMPADKTKLLRIAAIYEEMGLVEKMKMYQAAAAK